jgi:hypothetical protein
MSQLSSGVGRPTTCGGGLLLERNWRKSLRMQMRFSRGSLIGKRLATQLRYQTGRESHGFRGIAGGCGTANSVAALDFVGNAGQRPSLRTA